MVAQHKSLFKNVLVPFSYIQHIKNYHKKRTIFPFQKKNCHGQVWRGGHMAGLLRGAEMGETGCFWIGSQEKTIDFVACKTAESNWLVFLEARTNRN